jgi:glycosyltransferase involved in cell wall biosynthesis
VAVFMGSWHGPNLDAVRDIFRFADRAPHVRFLILGSSCHAFKDAPPAHNIGMLGVVDDDAKDAILGIADIALNPVVSGSGTNLKMLDYFASGLPVISTAHGVRGLRVRDREHVIIAEPGGFPEAIARICREDVEVKKARIENARRLAEERFAWPVIASKFWSVAQARGSI